MMKILLLILFMFPFNQKEQVKISVTVSKYKTLVCDKSPFTIRDTNRMRQRLPD